ncbi:MAG: hypothetical protein J5I93_11960 [Pirellulaceae bacterium]|nr:hypothetical protein [Pirellulaceae bacterium]
MSHPLSAMLRADARPPQPTIDQLLSKIKRKSTLSLASIPGLQLSSPFQGQFPLGQQWVDVALEPSGSVRVSLEAAWPEVREAALRASHDVGGNLRYVRQGARVLLQADTYLVSTSQLDDSLREIRAGLWQLLGRSKRAQPEPPVSHQRVQQALADLAWDPQSIVATDAGWELRPRLAGEAVAVRMELREQPAGLRLWRPLLERLRDPASAARVAVTDAALRLNSLLRLSRLAERDGVLVCEAHLHGGLIEGRWLDVAARAVAAGSQFAQPRLQLLHEQDALAALYQRVMVDTACSS